MWTLETLVEIKLKNKTTFNSSIIDYCDSFLGKMRTETRDMWYTMSPLLCKVKFRCHDFKLVANLNLFMDICILGVCQFPNNLDSFLKQGSLFEN